MPPKKRILLNKALWHNFKFKYKISIFNENTLEEVGGIRISKLNGLSVLLATVLLIFIVTSLIMVFTPLRNYLPGYMNSEVRAQIVRNALLVDSIEEVLHRQNMYIMNIQDIFSGTVRVDTTNTMEELTTIRKDSLMERTEREEEFRRQYEEAEKYNLMALNLQAEKDGMIFYAPIRGHIINSFNLEAGHWGTDIVASPNESVLAVLDGVVILSLYTVNMGHVLVVQHNQNFISVYKHCGLLLKEKGDYVKGGEVVALLGKTGTIAEDPHLHFELWLKDRAVDSQKYIIY